MKKAFSTLFAIDGEPRRGLIAAEWAVLAYMAATAFYVLAVWDTLSSPYGMLAGRLRIGAVVAALWAAYRLAPCRAAMLARVAAQLWLLSWWYPDTYELNKALPNWDHLLASWEQWLFGCQPSLEFWRLLPGRVASEAMYFGYAAYYPMIAAVACYYFIRRYSEFTRAAFVILGAFFLYYVVFVAFPATGPQYYFGAIGMDSAAVGHFPPVGTHFATHLDRVANPGWDGGFFYSMVEAAHNAGERPTAAFPSSHVGMGTVVMLLALRSRSRALVGILAVPYALMCLSTVYIQAHYAIDAIAGLVSGAAFYFALMAVKAR